MNRLERSRRSVLFRLSLPALAAWTACAPYSVKMDLCPRVKAPTAASDTVRVRYLGVGGFLLEHRGAVVLTAPLYSNPSIVEIAFDHAVRADRARIDALLPEEAAEAQAILVGHAHYDHLMDVPHVASEHALAAGIYGNDSMVALLTAVAPALASRVQSVQTAAGDHETPGQWIPVSARVRFMPFRSAHSLQTTLTMPLAAKLPLHLWRGEVGPSDPPPRSASDWAEGQVLAYLVDYLDDDGAPLFRVYYQDSGTDPPAGHLPASLLEEKAVDLALLCVGGDLPHLPRHPRAILDNLRPRFVLLGHWEDFFVPQDVDARLDGRVQELPTKHTKEFLKRITAAGYRDRTWLPCPTESEFEFEVVSR